MVMYDDPAALDAIRLSALLPSPTATDWARSKHGGLKCRFALVYPLLAIGGRSAAKFGPFLRFSIVPGNRGHFGQSFRSTRRFVCVLRSEEHTSELQS